MGVASSTHPRVKKEGVSEHNLLDAEAPGWGLSEATSRDPKGPVSSWDLNKAARWYPGEEASWDPKAAMMSGILMRRRDGISPREQTESPKQQR
jgi:hypothetical protein